MSQQEWRRRASELLDAGKWFLAHEVIERALRSHPDDVELRLFEARVLQRVGALEEARKRLEVLCATIEGSGASTADSHRSEAFGLLGGVYKRLWTRTGNADYAARSRDRYRQAFDETNAYWLGINAASMSWLIDERAEAAVLARRVLDLCEQALRTAEGDELYWGPATIGEARLLLGEGEAAVVCYRQAVDWPGCLPRHKVSSLDQLRLLAAGGLEIPAEILEALAPPVVVAFTGHMIDEPGRREPRFPPELEPLVRERIDAALAELDASIGYVSAACGADLLFIEAMLDRPDSETNIVLPFAREDFVRISVAHGGPTCIPRFDAALERADSVSYVTREGYLDSEELFAFGGRLLQGFAYNRARSLLSDTYLLAVLDRSSSQLPGGTADLVTRWGAPERIRVVDLAELRREHPASVVRDPAEPLPTFADDVAVADSDRRTTRRTIKTLLFADVVGFSRIEEQHVPFFMYRFLERVSDTLKRLDVQPSYVNTWGDAIFAVMDDSTPMVEYALALQGAVCDTDWKAEGLPAEMNIRIGLHAGPVFEGRDPFTGGTNYYGSHVNRAARLEPVTVPGHVYASEQFVALWTAEQMERGVSLSDSPVSCEFLGTMELAKKFGAQPVYHIHR